MKSARRLVLIVHNVRSSHNVGSLLRTAEGLGIKEVIFTGYTPYPKLQADSRLPHIASKVTRAIHKTALGAETTQRWRFIPDIEHAINQLRNDNFAIWAVEQSTNSITLPDFSVPSNCALLVGREVEGVEAEVLAHCDGALEIPMFGQKESFNVAQAAAMALYHCTFQ